MSLVDLSTTAASNNAAAPTGAPEGSFLLGDVSNTFREMMAVVRSLAASDTIAAAATTDLGSKTYATFLTLTGTATTITGLGTVSAGIYKFVVYNAAHSVTHNATSLILQGGASHTFANGDVSLFVSLGSGNWRELFYSGGAYQPLDADLTAIAALAVTDGNFIVGNGSTWVAESGATARTSLGIVAASDTAAGIVELATNAEAVTGTDTARATTPAGVAAALAATSVNALKAWVRFDGTSGTITAGSSNVASVTRNGLADYTVNFSPALSDANYCFNISMEGVAGASGYVVPMQIGTLSTTALQIKTLAPSNGAGPTTDATKICVSIFR